jgi:hypothetical protein
MYFIATKFDKKRNDGLFKKKSRLEFSLASALDGSINFKSFR